jgi:hypothetical protein
MVSASKELEEELLEVGNKLVDPPSSVEDLLRLLFVSTLYFFSHFASFVLFL